MTALLPLLSLTLAFAPQAKSKFEPMPIRASSLGAAVADGHAYIYGGHTGKTHSYSNKTASGRFFRVKLSGGAWEELPSGPAVQGLALVAHKGKIYRIGGMQPRNKPGEKADNHSLTFCAFYDPQLRKWTDLPSLPEGRSSHDAVFVGDKLYVVGGWNMQGDKVTWHKSMLVLDLGKQDAKWQTLEQPFQRRALGAAVVGGKILVIAGLGAKGTSSQMDIFDPETGKWSQGPNFPGGARNGFSPAPCVIEGRLHVSGPDGKIHRLNAAGKAWEHVGTQQIKRFVHRLVPGENGSILVLGGAAHDDDSRKVEEIRPASGTRTSLR